MSNHNQRQRSSADMSAASASVDASLSQLSREEIAHGEGRAPRVPMNTGDFNLQYPAALMKPDKKYYWFADDGKGRIEAAKAAWWDHVADEQGVNISAMSGARRMYLMCIDKIYYDEDEALREKNYRASIGETEEASSEGLSTYVPSGNDNKIRVNSDPFA